MLKRLVPGPHHGMSNQISGAGVSSHICCQLNQPGLRVRAGYLKWKKLYRAQWMNEKYGWGRAFEATIMTFHPLRCYVWVSITAFFTWQFFQDNHLFHQPDYFEKRKKQRTSFKNKNNANFVVLFPLVGVLITWRLILFDKCWSLPIQWGNCTTVWLMEIIFLAFCLISFPNALSLFSVTLPWLLITSSLCLRF